MIAGACTLAAFVLLCSLARELCRDFYRPHLMRRWQRERAELRELDEWFTVLRAVGVSAARAAESSRQLAEATNRVSDAMRAMS